MSRITEELTPEYVNSILQYGADIAGMIMTLKEKGWELSMLIESLEELEGESEIDGGLRILMKCPMVPVLKAIKSANAFLTGEEKLPDFYPAIVSEYVETYPDDAAILHPLCIVHQQIRKAFGEKGGIEIQQIACRSGETGKVVHSRRGLERTGKNEEDATELLGERACLYACGKMEKEGG